MIWHVRCLRAAVARTGVMHMCFVMPVVLCAMTLMLYMLPIITSLGFAQGSVVVTDRPALSDGTLGTMVSPDCTVNTALAVNRVSAIAQ